MRVCISTSTSKRTIKIPRFSCGAHLSNELWAKSPNVKKRWRHYTSSPGPAANGYGRARITSEKLTLSWLSRQLKEHFSMAFRTLRGTRLFALAPECLCPNSKPCPGRRSLARCRTTSHALVLSPLQHPMNPSRKLCRLLVSSKRWQGNELRVSRAVWYREVFGLWVVISVTPELVGQTRLPTSQRTYRKHIQTERDRKRRRF
jgi:hypothetical protein